MNKFIVKKRKRWTKGETFKALSLSALFLFSFLFLISFTSASSAGYNYLNGQEVKTGQNYSINVNNSNYFQGYTPTTLGTYLQSLMGWITNSVSNLVNYYTKTEINNSYIPYTGANQNVNLGANNLIVNTNTLFVDSANGRVGVGTASPTGVFHIAQPSGYSGELSSTPLTHGNGWEYNEGVEYTYTTNAGVSYLSKLNFLTIGRTYRLSYEVVANPSSTPMKGDVLNYFLDGYLLTTVGTHTYDSVAVTDDLYLRVNVNQMSGLVIKNISVKEVFAGVPNILVVTASGNVGIGTTSPAYQLDIRTTVGGAYPIFINNTGAGAFIGVKDSTGTSSFGRYAGNTYFETNTGTDIDFLESGVNRLKLKSGGNVGIGTTVPVGKLNVNGTGILLNISNQTNTHLIVNGTSGNVGIGTANPLTKLHVNGSILANGTINATTGFGVNGNSGITGNYTILKDADLVMLTKTYCYFNITGGIITGTNC